MSRTVRLINGKGDWEATPPTGATDADLYQLANDFIVQGGVINLDGGDGQVVESDTPAFSVKIKKGTLYVPNSSWVANSTEPKYYQVVADADETLAIPTNSSGDTRVDLIAQKIDKVTAPNDEATNVSPIVRIAGTPGSGAPSLPADHLLLATLNLADGFSSVTNAMITDNRTQVYLETKDINGGFVTLTDGTNITIDLASNRKRKFTVTLHGNRTFIFTNAKEGDTFELVIINDGTPRVPVWPAGVDKWIGIEDDPDLSLYLDANKTGIFVFQCYNQTDQKYYGFFVGAEE